jgi:hypothetical protein
MNIRLDEIDLDTRVQPRVALDEDVLNMYIERKKHGEVPPPIVLFWDADDEKYRIGDGWHRVEMSRRLEEESIEAIVYEGDWKAARMYSEQVNNEHGIQLTREDKRKIIEDRAVYQYGNFVVEDGVYTLKPADELLAAELGIGGATVRRIISKLIEEKSHLFPEGVDPYSLQDCDILTSNGKIMDRANIRAANQERWKREREEQAVRDAEARRRKEEEKARQHHESQVTRTVQRVLSDTDETPSPQDDLMVSIKNNKDYVDDNHIAYPTEGYTFLGDDVPTKTPDFGVYPPSQKQEASVETSSNILDLDPEQAMVTLNEIWQHIESELDSAVEEQMNTQSTADRDYFRGIIDALREIKRYIVKVIPS